MFPDVRPCQSVVAGMLLDSARVDGCLDFTHSGLELNELDVGVVVAPHLGLQTPVSIFADLIHDEGEWSGVGHDALEEPGRDDVGGRVTGDGGESLELVRVNEVVGATRGAGDALNVSCEELDTIRLYPEVGDEAHVFFKAIRALLCVIAEGGRGAGLFNHEVFALVGPPDC